MGSMIVFWRKDFAIYELIHALELNMKLEADIYRRVGDNMQILRGLYPDGSAL